MNLLATAPQWAIWLLLVLLVCAAAQDAVQLRISNVITAAVLLLAIASAIIVGPSIDLWQNVTAFAVVLAVGTFLFARGVFGGGDVKLFAAVALWAGGLTAVRLVAVILIAGGLLALVIILLRLFTPSHWSKHVLVLGRRAGIPYGIAIALGTMLMIALSAPSHPPQHFDPRKITTLG